MATPSNQHAAAVPAIYDVGGGRVYQRERRRRVRCKGTEADSHTYRVGQKRGHRLMTIILSILNRLIFFTVRFPGKFAVKWISTISKHLVYVDTQIKKVLFLSVGVKHFFLNR